ncbi:Transmembrane protein [Fasciolopsis buskii]|uniref:Transmembrane protein n=1 Tax=Fasciolopsis buskii TaxID=27845 RepID=A0A8E0VF45_9TREM|nr:Transmembrane protein [Fasciolopsis buski]
MKLLAGHQNTNSAVGSSTENPFEISRKFELGEMFNVFFGRLGNFLFYLNICIYLYGDLAIYAAGVPKSLRNVVCESNNSEVIMSNDVPCWSWSNITRGALYRVFVVSLQNPKNLSS